MADGSWLECCYFENVRKCISILEDGCPQNVPGVPDAELTGQVLPERGFVVFVIQ